MRRRAFQPIVFAGLLVSILATGFDVAAAQEVPLGWDAVGYFQYNVENVVVDTSKTPWKVKVIFSVTDPSAAGNPPWDIKMSGPPFKCSALTLPACPTPGPSPSLTIDIGWNTAESVNTGSRFNPATGAFDLSPVFVNATNNRGLGAALPIRINALSSAVACASAADCPGVPDIYLRFWVSSPLPPALIGAVQTGVVGSGTVGIEGHPVWPPEGPTENVPVRSAVAYFPITSPAAVPRRRVVDFDTKCANCHDGEKHGDTVVPRLALHGGNRNEEPMLCTLCHNPNQTDIPYRSASSPASTDPLGSGVAPEVSVDFKRMIHSIHAGGVRTTSFKVVGFNGTVADFGAVRFPAELRDCSNCHVESGGKGTFELPLASQVLGSTVKTGSTIGYVRPSDGQTGNLVDLDPTNNLRITPIASVCSGCHDRKEVRDHMIKQGARFGVLQASLDSGLVRERCASCHGPGKSMDVRRVHEVGVSDD